MCRVLNIKCWVRAGWSVVGSAAHSYAWMGLDWDWVCLSWVEIGWHCVCVGLAGAGSVGEQPIGSAVRRTPALFGWSQERDGNRHHTRAAVISQPDNAPTIQPTTSRRPPTTAHGFVAIATEWLCASQRLAGDVVSGLKNLGETVKRQKQMWCRVGSCTHTLGV